MRNTPIILLLLALSVGSATALATSTNATDTIPNAPGSTNASVPAFETDPKTWSFYVSMYGYFAPDSRDYVQPTVTADHGGLHLEARYNYESLNSGSLWLGYNFHAGEKLSLEFTPMLGGVFGNTTGVAPGYKFSLSYWKFELSSEGEFVVNTRDTAESFFYNWSELSVAPMEWFRVGLALQRTRLYQTDRDVQRGFLVGFAYKKVSFTTYVFNPDESRPTVVLGLGVAF